VWTDVPLTSGRIEHVHVMASYVKTADAIDVYFNRVGIAGGMLVVVAVGADVYAARGSDPVAALHAAASRAAEDLALLGKPVDEHLIVQHGLLRLRAVTPP
jgi:hypothetical protein